jgi:hypothetical protein
MSGREAHETRFVRHRMRVTFVIPLVVVMVFGAAASASPDPAEAGNITRAASPSGSADIAWYVVTDVRVAGVPISLYVRERVPSERLARENADG